MTTPMADRPVRGTAEPLADRLLRVMAQSVVILAHTDIAPDVARRQRAGEQDVMATYHLPRLLVRVEALPEGDAISIACELHRLSPRFFTAEILEEFRRQVSS